jgi:hypothetical protein
MNLVQVQEHLKDVPLQALMGYANGSSQMVPAYLALGEMNRRKQMEKRAAEPPKSTVKDEIEQQAQPPAVMPNQGIATMQPPMEEMATEDHAYGGITGLPSNFQFDGGGIVSFKEGSEKAVKEFDEEGLPLSKSQKAALLGKKSDAEDAIQADLARDQVVKLREARMNIKNPYQQDVNPDLVKGMQEFYKPRFMPEAEPAIQVSSPVAAPSSPAPGANIAATAQNVQPQVNQVRPPATGIGGLNQGAPQQTQAAAPTNPFMAQLLKNVQAAPEELANYEDKRKAAEGQDEYLKRKPGELMETEIASQRKRQEDARQRFEENEKAKKMSDFYGNLIKAGKATAGRKGIGALVGGYGEASIASEEDARQRREQFENLDNEKNLNFTKMNQEIENARIARSEGRFKDAYTHENEAKAFKRAGEKIQSEAAAAGARVLSEEQIAKDRNAATIKAAGMSTGEERSLGKYVSDWLAKPENKGKTYSDAVAAYRTIVSGGKLETAKEALAIRRQALLDKNQPYQMASMQFYSAKDPEKKAKAKATMDAIEQKELGVSPSTVDTSGFGEPRVKSK